MLHYFYYYCDIAKDILVQNDNDDVVENLINFNNIKSLINTSERKENIQKEKMQLQDELNLSVV